MCTELKGKASWFLPFNKGYNDGAGNAPNADGIKTNYLWKEMLRPAGLTDILENYRPDHRDQGPQNRQEEAEPGLSTLPPARCCAEGFRAIRDKGVGKRYLIQHSAGSGK